MPNLGGRWIDEEDIQRVESLTGEERKEEYYKIIQFIHNNFSMTSLMLQIRYVASQTPDGQLIWPIE